MLNLVFITLVKFIFNEFVLFLISKTFIVLNISFVIIHNFIVIILSILIIIFSFFKLSPIIRNFILSTFLYFFHASILSYLFVK